MNFKKEIDINDDSTINQDIDYEVEEKEKVNRKPNKKKSRISNRGTSSENKYNK